MSKLTDEQKIEVVEKYISGKNCKQIADEYNMSKTAIHRLIKRRNIPINKSRSEHNRRYPLNENYFDVIDTEEKAYFLGLLYADGCNAEEANQIIIGLQEEDKEILEKLRTALGTTKPLAFKNRQSKNPNWKNVYGLTVTSKHMSKRLAELGCFARKSLALKFPTEDQVPKHLIRHFIRGYFDGDGCCTIYKKKNTNRFRVTASFVSTLDFCNCLIKIFKQELDVNCSMAIRHKDRNNSTRQLYINGNIQAIKFLDWLYLDAQIYLLRKFNKLISVKETLLVSSTEEYIKYQ